jgi:poly(A) polymerase-like protein
MNEDIIKSYSDLIINKNIENNIVLSAIDVVKRYVRQKALIIIGGQSIDYALKSKAHTGIYEKNTIPDIDVFSDTHYQDAYDIAVILAKKGFTGISVINALHPSTMKIRVNFYEICDISYIPTNIIKQIPVIWYIGYKIIHPHFQYIDQHKSLSHPFENPPFETIMNRPKKDMQRYDLLYALYPLRILNVKTTTFNLFKRSINTSILNNQCVNGFFALIYWIQNAKKLGFQTNLNIGYIDLSNTENITYQLPTGARFVFYSNDIKSFYNTLKDTSSDITFYSKFLDKLPRKVIIGNYEIFDNIQLVTAHKITIGKETEIYIANLQLIMFYFLINYVIIAKTQLKKRDYIYYVGYLLCRNLISWASEVMFSPNNKFESDSEEYNLLRCLLPTTNIYGNKNITESLTVSKYVYEKRMGIISEKEKYLYSQPNNIFDRDLIYKKIPKNYLKFNMGKSEIFNTEGKIIPNFLENENENEK